MLHIKWVRKKQKNIKRKDQSQWIIKVAIIDKKIGIRTIKNFWKEMERIEDGMNSKDNNSMNVDR